MKLPEVKWCCFCFPLRPGIILLGIFNVMFTLGAIGSLILRTEMTSSSLTDGSSLEEVTSAVLFGILGMGVILNVLLLVGGCQKDISMLRLYIFYAALLTLAALVSVVVLWSSRQLEAVYGAMLAVVMQIYVIVLTRSEIIKLEEKALRSDQPTATDDHLVNVPDTDTLL